MRIAFLTLYPIEAASTRHRVYMNLRHFPADISAEVFPGVSSGSYRRLRRLGANPLGRGVFQLEEAARKLWHLWRARGFDLVVVQKGLTQMGLRGFPALLFRLGKPVVFDFDDAVHLGPAQRFRSPLLRSMTQPRQVLEILARATMVVAGNQELAAAAQAHNPCVHVVPTAIDVAEIEPAAPRAAGKVLGWSGSTATNHYVNRLAPILRRVAERIPDIELRVISDGDAGIHWPEFAGVATRFVPWRLQTANQDHRALDIGLMPLPDDPWSRGKCGGKLLYYMACGIPAVASPVGVNVEMVKDGVTGLLPRSDQEWVSAIVRLIEDPELRLALGAAARRLVMERYASDRVAPRLADLLRQAAGGAGTR